MTFKHMRVIVDQDPDNADGYSLWTDEAKTINVELAKISDLAVANYIAELWNKARGNA